MVRSSNILKEPVFLCSCAGACAFGIMTLLLVLYLVDAVSIAYYVNHAFIAVLIFLFTSALHYGVVSHFKLTDGAWLTGFFSALPFYLSREIRDAEKLGHWDWPGLWWPTVAIIVLLVMLETSTALWRRRRGRIATGSTAAGGTAWSATGLQVEDGNAARMP